MYLSNSKRLLFIAIPKTACSSIMYALSSNKSVSDDSPTQIWNFKYPEIYHSTLKDLFVNLDKTEHLGFDILGVDNSFDTYSVM